MSGVWEIGAALSQAQLQATITAADAGSGNSRIRIYNTARPVTIGTAHADAPQAEIVLAKPCASIVDGLLVIHPADEAGAMVLQQGLPRWGDWISAAGVVLARGDVTDMAHDGCWRVMGGQTPTGETSPLLYAGGLVVLGSTTLS